MTKFAKIRALLATSTAIAGSALLLAAPAAAQSLPDTGNVTTSTAGLSGGAPGSTNPTFSNPNANTLQVDLKDNRTILNWGGNGFNVAAGNTVDFKDSRASSGVTGRTDNIAVLNRDLSGNVSTINGTVRSDGNIGVYLINTNGIVFGGSSAVNTGAFFSSTLDLTDADFLDGAASLDFSSASSGTITINSGAQFQTAANNGTTGDRMGDLVFLGGLITASGTFQATNGDVAFIAGRSVTVQNSAGSPLSFTITNPSNQTVYPTLINVAGAVSGRNVTMATAKATGGNNEQGITVAGTITATGAAITDRGVVLSAGTSAPGVTACVTNCAVGGSIIQSAAINSSKDIVLATQRPAQAGIEMANGSLSATGAILVDSNFVNGGAGTITGGSVTLPARIAISGLVKSTTGDITFTNLTANDNVIALRGGIDSFGNITGSAVEWEVGGPGMKAGGDVNIEAGFRGTFNIVETVGDFIVADSNSVYATASFGSVTAGGDIRIARHGQLSGGTFSATGSVYLQGDVALTAQNVQAGADVTLISNGNGLPNSGVASGNIGIDSVQAGANGDLVVQAVTLTNAGQTNSPDIVLSAGRDIKVTVSGSSAALGQVIAGRNAELAGYGYSRVSRLEGTTGYVKVNVTQGATVSQISAGTDAIGSGASLAFVDIAAARDISLTSTGSTVTVGDGTTAAGGATAGGNLTINATSGATLRGNITVGGDLAVQGTSVSTGALTGQTSSIKAKGAVTLTSTTGNVSGGGSLTIQSNSDGIGNEALTINSAGAVGFTNVTTLLGGTARQSDIQIRNPTGSTVQLGGVSARSILSATGTNPFANGITRTGSVSISGPANLINSLFVQGSTIQINAVTVTAGDIDLRGSGPITIGGAAVASGDINVRTSSGDLTIGAAGSLSGTNVILSTPAAFKNLAGAGAVTASNHWVIYSADPAANTFGNLDSNNTALWNGTFATIDPSTITGNRYVFSIQPTVTIATANFSKVYGTDLNASGAVIPFTATGLNAGVAGAYRGDTVATALAGSPQITSAGFDPRASVAGGPYSQTLAIGTLTSPTGYAIALGSTAGVVTVTPKQLTATATANSKTYDGTTSATGSVALNGVVAGDTVGTSGSVFTFADKNAGTGKTVSVTGTALTGADAGNYTLAGPASVLADIFKKTLTATATADSKTYDGTTAGSGTVALNGVVSGDTVGTSGSVFTFADKNAGTGKTVTVTGTTLTGADAGNYILTLPLTALADILKKAITGTVTANGKTYDGTTAGTGTVALNGVVSGDTVGTAGTVFTFSDKNAGTGKTVTITGTTLTGADAGNYTLTLPASALADILKKAITGIATPDNKTYDGTTAGTGTVALSGVVAGDTVTGKAAFTFADKNAGTGKTVTYNGTTLSGADAGNYTVTATPSAALADILKKALTATVTVNTRTYDGTTAATGSVALNGVVAGETVGTSGTVLVFADKNAGTGKTVTVTGTTLTGSDAGNYTLTVPASALGTINKRQLTITPDSLSKDQGEPDPVLTFAITAGSLISGDALSGALGRAPGEAPGNYAILIGTLTGGPNYDLQVAATTFAIFAKLGDSISELQALKVVPLPQQVNVPGNSSEGGVTIDDSSVCGADESCTASE